MSLKLPIIDTDIISCPACKKLIVADYRIKNLKFESFDKRKHGFEVLFKASNEIRCNYCLQKFRACIDVYEYPRNVFDVSIIDKESIELIY